MTICFKPVQGMDTLVAERKQAVVHVLDRAFVVDYYLHFWNSKVNSLLETITAEQPLTKQGTHIAT